MLPALFDTMGGAGLAVSLVFFALMTIAALTSSISMLEVPVSYSIENHGFSRKRSVYIIGCGIGLVSAAILLNLKPCSAW